MLGWNSGYVPKFVRQYADLRSLASKAIKEFREQVRDGTFPGVDESFG
jgi:3-methyl-2-oxobutanoate hydroxymethyltransferase